MTLRLALLALALLGLVACGGSEPDAPPAGGGQPAEEAVAAPEETPSDSAPFAGVAAELLRGRVLDNRTAQGVGELWVRLRRRGVDSLVATDARGYFVADRPLPEGMVSALVGLGPDGPWLEPALFRLEHVEATAAETKHVLRVEIGPSYSLDFLSVASAAPERWEARILETGVVEGESRSWSWQILRRGELPRLRYPTIEHEPSPRFNAHIELRLRGSDWFSRAPVNSTVGEYQEPVRLRLVQYAAFGGFVVDSEGAAVSDAEVSLLQRTGSVFPAADPDWRTSYSGNDGSFAFERVLEPGTYHLRLRSQGRADALLQLEIAEGGLSGYELRVPALEIAGAIRGVLRGQGAESRPQAILSLRSIDDGGIGRVLHPSQVGVPFGLMKPVKGGMSFVFDRVPAGRYELAVFPLDGCAWEPFSREVEPPETELVFECRDDSPRGTFRFVLLDALGAGELPRGEITFRTEQWWNPEGLFLESGAPIEGLPLDSPLTWMIHAPGYRPAYGALAESEGEGAERRILVELQPGWGAELLLRDASQGGERADLDTWAAMARVYQTPPVVGVEVLADGRPVGVSDELGRVRFSLDEKPGRIEVGGTDWVVLDSKSFRDGSIVDPEAADPRIAVLWLSPGK